MTPLLVLGYAAGAAGLALALPKLAALAPVESAGAGLGLFLALTLAHEAVSRRGRERDLLSQLGQVRRAATENAAELDGARREIARLRDVTRAAEDRLEQELSALRPLLGEVAKRLERRRTGMAAGLETARLPEPDLTLDEQQLMDVVRLALEENRVELWLQPVVSLPQRKTRFYEAYSRLRTADGVVIPPEQYLPLAAQAGLAGLIDNLLLFRCVHLVRRVRARNRAITFFCNISAASLADEAFFEQFADFLADDRELAEQLVFEFDVADLLAANADILAHLDRLAAMGFRFSADHVEGLDLDFAELGRRHVRWLKLDTGRLLSPDFQAEAPIVVHDLKEALHRASIDLVAEKVEHERQVAELLELGVDFAQGNLFGEPRPAKPI